MLPLIAVGFVLAAPVPKDEPVKPESVTDRHALLLRDNRMQRELGLSAEKRVTLIDFFEAFDEENGRFVGMLYPPSGPGETREAVLRKQQQHAEFDAKQRKRMQGVAAGCLTASQFARLRELERRCLSIFAFTQPDVVAGLKLTADQIRTVRTATADYREKHEEEYDTRKKPSGLSPHGLARPFLAGIEKTLTDAQRKRWAELLGAEPKIAQTEEGISRGLLVIAVRDTPSPR